MMRRFIRWLLLKPVLWATARFSSKPDRARIFNALSKLYGNIIRHPGKKGLVIPFELYSGKFIIFSDQHKGARNGADDFAMAEPNYLSALDYYNRNGFQFISLGDNEELWENSLAQVKKNNNRTFDAEKKFIDRNAFVKIFGNHDLYWQNDPFASLQLKSIYNAEIKIYEGVILVVEMGARPLHVFCTHGHQGDAQSDGNWFSKFFVSNIWGPLQGYLRINPNTPAYNNEEKTLHNEIMYDWAARQKNILLVTGHTHQPVFESLTLLESLYKQMQAAKRDNNSTAMEALRKKIGKSEREFSSVSIDYLTMKPAYFNSGCCCFSDGDITGLEIDQGCFRLIRWTLEDERSQRSVLEEISLEQLVKRL
ncbi:MAG: metallophosphoesterase [Chitinophagaceae bacterium]|nr:metallophosphoesterase [Chitinophagaceae bacterium]